jgi:hypothetical protein
VAVFNLRYIFCSLILALLVLTSGGKRAVAQGGPGGSGQHMQDLDCPPGTQGPFKNCQDYWNAINKESLRLGYRDSDGNGTADFLESYTIHVHDCADVAAEVACVSRQSNCINQTAQQLRSRSAYHSDNYIEGIGECDFTPSLSRGGSQANRGNLGGGLANRRDTTIDEGAPDAGETVDPAYTCALNGARRSAFGGRGGGGGGSSLGTLAILAMLFNQSMMNQLTPVPTAPVTSPTPDGKGADNKDLTPTPTPKPEPTLQPTATSVPATPVIDSVRSDIYRANSAKVEPQLQEAPQGAAIDSDAAWTKGRGDIFGN